MMWALRGLGAWSADRGGNLLDGGAPFYDTYTCADGRWIAVGALEPQFYRALLAGLELDPAALPDQQDRSGWPILRARLAGAFVSQSRDHWVKVFDGTDACVTPVLSFDEVAQHPHMAARRALVEIDGIVQPAPAPRFSRSTTETPRAPHLPGADTAAVIEDWLGALDDTAR
jgi:alpha-methylacyl-CoA racemase